MLVTDSKEMLRLCSEGKSQPETLPLKDFFLRSGGWGAWRTRGRGGGGGGAVTCSGRDGGREETMEEDGDGVVNAAEASVKGVRREGMWTVLEGPGAVFGRVSACGSVTLVANEGAIGGVGTLGRFWSGGGGGIGSRFVRRY